MLVFPTPPFPLVIAITLARCVAGKSARMETASGWR
jgi:hypothetical protein